MTDLSAWAVAHKANREKVIAHKDFPALVRAVAVAEQPSGIPKRYRLNSRTMGLWYTRGANGSHYMRWPLHQRNRRAYVFAERIALETGVLEMLPMGERKGMIYVIARDYVRARERGITVR